MHPARNVALATLVSRVLGLVRDKVTVFVFPEALRDAIVLAWTVPNLFRRLFGEGALGISLVPVLTRTEKEHGDARRDAAASSVLCALVTLLLPLASVLLALLWLVPESTLAAPFESHEVGLATVRLLRWMLPYMVLVCVAAQLQTIANLVGRFFLPAISPALSNVTWILAAVLAGVTATQGELPCPTWVAVGVLVGGGLQLLLQWAELRRVGVVLRPAPLWTAEVRAVALRALPMLVGLAASQVNLVIDRWIAESMIVGDGAVTNLYLANRLMQLPLGLIGAALGTAVYPVLARGVAAGDHRQVSASISAALRMVWFLGLPAALGLCLVAQPILSLLFEGGSFDRHAAARSAACLIAYAPSIVFQSVVLLIARLEYARGNHARVVRFSLGAVLLNVLLDFTLVGPMGAGGLAFATTMAALFNAVLLGGCLRSYHDHPWRRELVIPLVRLLGVSLCMGAVVLGARGLIAALPLPTWSRVLGVSWPVESACIVVVCMTLGMLAFLTMARAVAPREWNELRSLLRRRRSDRRAS